MAKKEIDKKEEKVKSDKIEVNDDKSFTNKSKEVAHKTKEKFQKGYAIFEEKLSEYGGKIGNQRHFASIRDAFMTFMPIIIVGALGTLINNVFIAEWSLLADWCGVNDNQDLYNSWANVAFYLSPIFVALWDASFAVFSLYVAFLLGYFLMGSYGDDKLWGGIVALAAFLTLQPIAAGELGGWWGTFAGPNGLILAFFAALTAPMLFRYFNNKEKLKIKMPEGVPPAVAKSFSALFPIMITLGIYAIIQPTYGAIAYGAGFGKDTIKGVDHFTFTVSAMRTLPGNEIVYENLQIVVEKNSEAYAYLVGSLQNGTINANEAWITNFVTKYGLLPEIDLGDGFSEWEIIFADVPPVDWPSGLSFIAQNDIYTAFNSLTEVNGVLTLTPGNDDFFTGITADKGVRNGNYYLVSAIYDNVATPFLNVAGHPAMIFFVVFLICLFWFVGVHGSNIMAPIIEPVYGVMTLQNVDLYSNNVSIGSGEYHNFTKQSLDAFVYIGGTGATLALILAIFIFQKDKAARNVAKVSVGPGVFQINEPIMFGLPVILNPIYFIPFLLIMPFNALLTYLWTDWGWIDPTVAVLPWTTPFLISGFLATLDWRSLILSSVVFGVSFGGYLPFILMEVKKQAQGNVAVKIDKDEIKQKQKDSAKSSQSLSKENIKEKKTTIKEEKPKKENKKKEVNKEPKPIKK